MHKRHPLDIDDKDRTDRTIRLSIRVYLRPVTTDHGVGMGVFNSGRLLTVYASMVDGRDVITGRDYRAARRDGNTLVCMQG